MIEKKQKGLIANILDNFANITEKDFVKGIMFVIVTAVLASATNYLTVSRGSLPNLAIRGIFQAILPAIAFFATLVGFGFSIGIYHTLSRLLGGQGEIRRMAALGGYASLPMLGQHALRFVYFFLINDPTDLTPIGSGVVRILLNYFTIFSVTAIALTALAVKENYKVSGRRAIIIAFIPVLIPLVLAFLFRLQNIGLNPPLL